MLWSKILIGVGGGAVLLVGLAWLGTQVRLSSFAPINHPPTDYGTRPIPDTLPQPLIRYLQVATSGDELPVIQTAVLMGRADLTLTGLTLPARMKFYYEAGSAYYHYIQVGWFSIPLLTVNERFINGEIMMELPGETVQHNTQANAGANQALWLEAVWMPTLFLDERITWEAVDDNTVRMFIPNAPVEEAATIYFNPETGLIDKTVTLRYEGPTATERTLWTNHTRDWQRVNGVMIPMLVETQWADRNPWAIWRMETVQYNIDISKRMAQFSGTFTD